MTGKALICKLGKHQVIEGADRIVQVDMFGETIITQKTNEEGTIGLLFDCETQLSKEYAGANNMFRHSELNADKKVTGYMDDNGRVKPIKLKGVKCSGLFMPLGSLYNLNAKVPNLDLGTEIDKIGDIEICRKYVSKATQQAIKGNKQGRSKLNLAPTFKEHIDTDQWGRNSHKVKGGDLVIITEKLHGTSARCGYLPVKEKEYNIYQKIIFSICWLLSSFKWYNPFTKWQDKFNYKFIVGSRRVVKYAGEDVSDKDHYYSEDLWTKISKEYFEGKLSKGETVYFEIVGKTPSGELIMGSHSNTKLKNFMDKSEYKDFVTKYGEETTFNYGTDTYEVYVYRITMTNDDGDTIDYSWEQVKNRCDKMNVKHVPEIDKFIPQIINDKLYKPNSDTLEEVISFYTERFSDNFPMHIKEGVCIRVENGAMTPMVLKSKAYLFKVLEGIIKDSEQVDIEESN